MNEQEIAVAVAELTRTGLFDYGKIEEVPTTSVSAHRRKYPSKHGTEPYASASFAYPDGVVIGTYSPESAIAACCRLANSVIEESKQGKKSVRKEKDDSEESTLQLPKPKHNDDFGL